MQRRIGESVSQKKCLSLNRQQSRPRSKTRQGSRAARRSPDLPSSRNGKNLLACSALLLEYALSASRNLCTFLTSCAILFLEEKEKRRIRRYVSLETRRRQRQNVLSRESARLRFRMESSIDKTDNLLAGLTATPGEGWLEEDLE